jgi:hypothetical protein
VDQQGSVYELARAVELAENCLIEKLALPKFFDSKKTNF